MPSQRGAGSRPAGRGRASGGRSGPGATLALRGWPAVIALVVVVGLYGLTFVISRRALDDRALAPIRHQLQGEYTAALLPGVDTQNPDPAAVDRLTALDHIDFASVSVRGFGSDVIVRVEPRVDGAPPPDGRDVRYYRMSYSTLTGWRLRHETTALRYYTRLY
jgi:hypothetical protein